MEPTHFALAYVAGLIPAIFWLWFWLREDKKNPEPLFLIIVAFIAGMAVVPAALPLQQLAKTLFYGDTLIWTWVIIEEVLKYVAAAAVILWNKAVDEPIDMVVYMIVIALGFAALENTLFLLHPIAAGDIVNASMTGAYRFLGATLLHILASATVGVALAFAFCRSGAVQIFYAMTGLFLAILLHAFFNLTIMNANGGETILAVFLFVWIGIIILFLIFEKIKRVTCKV
jgi:RsiW-degrading membrane proteinase PrsW (M82 family)